MQVKYKGNLCPLCAEALAYPNIHPHLSLVHIRACVGAVVHIRACVGAGNHITHTHTAYVCVDPQHGTARYTMHSNYFTSTIICVHIYS